MSTQDLPHGTDITKATLKKIIWDIVPDDQVADMCELFEMAGDSPDVAAMEKQAAVMRRNQLAPIAPALDGISTITATVIERYMRTNGKDIEDSVKAIVYYSTVTVLANLIDLEMIHLPHFASQGS